MKLEGTWCFEDIDIQFRGFSTIQKTQSPKPVENSMLCFSRGERKFQGKGRVEKRKERRNLQKVHRDFFKSFVHFYKTKVIPVFHLVIHRRKLESLKVTPRYLLSSLADI